MSRVPSSSRDARPLASALSDDRQLSDMIFARASIPQARVSPAPAMGTFGQSQGRCQNSSSVRALARAPWSRPAAVRAFVGTNDAYGGRTFQSSALSRTSGVRAPATKVSRGARVATLVNGAEGASTTQATKDAIAVATKVKSVLAMILNSDGGMKMNASERASVDGLLADLERDGLKSAVNPNDDENIFGYYDVTYVSVGANQVGQPAGGRFRSPLGRFLFRTVGLEQNLFKPNMIENRVAFTLLGCLPGEVTLEGTFAPLAGADDGRTVEASFGSPGISIAGGPKLRLGPKSKVVLSTTYLDDRVRLGKGSRGSLFVFKRKSEEQTYRDHRRWRVGGLAISLMLATAVWLGFYGVHKLQTTNTFLHSCTIIAASLTSLAMAYILRDGGIVAEDADLDDGTILELTEEQQSFLSKGRSDGGKKGENVFNI